MTTHAILRHITVLTLFLISSGTALALTKTVQTEATVRGGIYANTNQDEAAAGYLHVKYDAATRDNARKTYFQFDLTGLNVDTNLPASFTISFTSSFAQRIRFWGLNQDYPDFTSAITWNQAQANELTSNNLLTNGAYRATQIGSSVLIPTNGTAPYTFSVPKLGPYLFNDRVTFVLTADNDVSNNSGGLRITRQTATLDFSSSSSNEVPILSAVSNVTIHCNHSSGLLSLIVTHNSDNVTNVSLFATSSNPSVIATSNIVFEGSGSNRAVTVTAGNRTGASTITLLAVDSQNQTGRVSFVVTVLADHYDVYLASGQSNMDGRGSAADLVGALASWSLPQTDVRIFYVNPMNSDPVAPDYNTGWQVLRPGWSVAPGFSGSLPSTTFGPELSFARTMADSNPERHIAIIKISKGGTSLSVDWNPNGSYLYSTLTNFVPIALKALADEGSSYTVRGMIWHQGESDGSSSTPVYQAELTEFIAAVRRDLGLANLPFIVGELATNRSTTVRQAQFNAAHVIPYVSFASSSNLNTLAADDPHFTAASQLIMGQRMAASIKPPPLQFQALTQQGSNVVFSASGLAGATCTLLMTTNLLTPLSQWEILVTGRIDTTGILALTNAAGSANFPSCFFRMNEQ